MSQWDWIGSPEKHKIYKNIKLLINGFSLLWKSYYTLLMNYLANKSERAILVTKTISEI